MLLVLLNLGSSINPGSLGVFGDAADAAEIRQQHAQSHLRNDAADAAELDSAASSATIQ
jgi:hypothetical protein